VRVLDYEPTRFAKEAPVKIATRTALALSACLLLGWSGSALGEANRVDGFVTKTVKFKNLEVSTAEGAQALYGRIGAAAREVCRAHSYATVRGCRAHAVEQAVQRVGNPLLSSIHRSEVERVEEVVLR
jgi:UrcA family protein